MNMAVIIIIHSFLLSVSFKRTEKYFREMNLAVCHHTYGINFFTRALFIWRSKTNARTTFTHLQLFYKSLQINKI